MSMDVSHSVYLYVTWIFLSNRTNFRAKTSFRQFLTWLLPGLKKYNLNYFQHWRCQSVGMSCNFWTYDGLSGRCLTTRQVLSLYIGWCLPIVVFPMADVVAILFVTDVFATVLYFGRCYCWCYCHSVWLVADVVATGAVVCATCGNVVYFVADVIAIFVGWCYCHTCCCVCGRCYGTMADGIAINKTDVIGRCYLPGWQME